MAIFYAVRRPGIKPEAFTTTFGNTDTAIATANTLRMLELLGRPDIPVAKGVARSLVHPYVRRADHVHGSNAIGDVKLPEPKIRAIDEHAGDLIIRMAKENPGEIALCPVGPLTNVALALVKAPEIAELLRKIVIMGSTIFHPGIHGPTAPMVDVAMSGRGWRRSSCSRCEGCAPHFEERVGLCWRRACHVGSGEGEGQRGETRCFVRGGRVVAPGPFRPGRARPPRSHSNDRHRHVREEPDPVRGDARVRPREHGQDHLGAEGIFAIPTEGFEEAP